MEPKNNPISNISEILSSDGESKESWNDLLCNIISGNTKTIQETVFYLKQKLITKEKVDLILDIIDFLLNFGSQEIIEQIASKDFLNTILSLLKNKSKSGVNIQKKIIFLTQKWHQKFEKEENQGLKGFSDNYNLLKKGGIIFPPQNYQIQTYNNYISEEEAQNSLMKANAIKKLTKESEEFKKSMNYANPFSNGDEDFSNNQENNNFLGENTTTVVNNNNNININNLTNNPDNINEINEKDNNNEINEKEKEKEKEEIDDENPYKQNNDNNINNINNNSDEKESFSLFENNNLNQNDNNNTPKNDVVENNNNNINQMSNIVKQSNQQSNYPTYPSQMNNINNNNFNNNNNNNKQFSKSQDINITPKNNMNNNYNHFSNYNNQQNNNNNNNNNNYNQKYKSSNPNYNLNNNRNNNNYNNSGYNNNNNNNNRGEQNDYIMEAKYYKRTLGKKLLQLNAWINEGKFSFNSGQLKKGIQEILDELAYTNSLMQRYQKIGQRQAYDIIRFMRMDIEQTCARYEALNCDKVVEPFYSSFQGNTRQYYYNVNNMFGLEQNYEYYNFDNYYQRSGNSNAFNSGFQNQNNYGYQNQSNYFHQTNQFEREKTFGDKLSDFGSGVKDGFIKFGKTIKNGAVSGYKFIKKKISDDDNDNDNNN